MIKKIDLSGPMINWKKIASLYFLQYFFSASSPIKIISYYSVSVLPFIIINLLQKGPYMVTSSGTIFCTCHLNNYNLHNNYTQTVYLFAQSKICILGRKNTLKNFLPLQVPLPLWIPNLGVFWHFDILYFIGTLIFYLSSQRTFFTFYNIFYRNMSIFYSPYR